MTTQNSTASVFSSGTFPKPCNGEQAVRLHAQKLMWSVHQCSLAVESVICDGEPQWSQSHGHLVNLFSFFANARAKQIYPSHFFSERADNHVSASQQGELNVLESCYIV